MQTCNFTLQILILRYFSGAPAAGVQCINPYYMVTTVKEAVFKISRIRVFMYLLNNNNFCLILNKIKRLRLYIFNYVLAINKDIVFFCVQNPTQTQTGITDKQKIKSDTEDKK